MYTPGARGLNGTTRRATSWSVARATGSATGRPVPLSMVTRLSACSILLLKRRTMRAGGAASTASCAGEASSTMAWARARAAEPARSPDKRRAARPATVRRRRPARGRERVTTSAPVVEHQVAGIFVLDLLAPLHANHG